MAFTGIGSGETAGFLHYVTLTIAAQTFQSPVVFAYGISTTGILGQSGFFDHFVATFDWTPNPPCFDLQRIPLKSIGAGLHEYRMDFGPGYRIYFGRDGLQLIILLGGGTKKRQQKDIKSALELWAKYKRRKKEI